jgi:hypothetical protein
VIVGGEFVGVVAAGAVTWMVKGASWAVAVPSDTLMVIEAYVPALPVEGVPESTPEDVSNVAHEGMFWIEKVSASPLVAVTLGWNEYSVPAATVVSGVPEIAGGLVVCAAVSF